MADSRAIRGITARLSLRTGGTAEPGPNLTTKEHLRFQLDHALARDAVHTALDTGLILRGLRDRKLEAIALRSAAADRMTYLRRPDLGRTLHADSVAALQTAVTSATELDSEPSDPAIADSLPVARQRVVVLLADGLSALAVERHALPLLDATLPLMPAPYPLVSVLTNARVALGDEVGALLDADLTLMLIGERPGLSSPDSLGVYLTWKPQVGRTDAERNCISNIHSEGLSYATASQRISHYVREAARLELTGTALKDPPQRTLPRMQD